jgi:ATP-dependent DNA helicase RecG
MRRYSDDELERMLRELESDVVERKESFKGTAPTAAREAVCAFANDLADRRQPGVLFVGVRDDGLPSGIAVTDELLRELADMKSDGNIVPPPTLLVEKRRVRGVDVAVVTVEPADSPPVRFKGRIHVRWGPRRGTASAQDERILSEKRRHGDRPFDVHALRNATISDLDCHRFESEYLPSAFAGDVLAANERSLEQRLAATKMIMAVDDPRPTVLGALVLGVRTRDFVPGAYVQFLRIAGTQLADPVADEAVIDGTVSEVLRRAHDKLVAHNRTQVDLASGQVEQRRSDYPLEALDQLLANGILHRAYDSTNAPVRISWFDDRIEILNPGGPFGSVTRENFGRPGIADYRNPNLAEALRVLGFVQRFGVGLAIARRALAAAGHPELRHEIEAHHVCAIVRARSA